MWLYFACVRWLCFACVFPLLRPVARPGDIIYDPFSGSGTTGAVAFEFGCNYIGVDVNPNFNQLASARLSELNK